MPIPPRVHGGALPQSLTESPTATGRAARDAPAASMLPARVPAAQVPPDRRVASEDSAFASPTAFHRAGRQQTAPDLPATDPQTRQRRAVQSPIHAARKPFGP